MSEQYEKVSSIFDADELSKLKKVDPDAVELLKEYFKSQQQHRLDIEKAESQLEIRRKEKLISRADKDASRFRAIQILGMICSFVLIMGGMYFSYSLLMAEKAIEGSFFGGGTVVAVGSIFTKFSTTHSRSKSN